MPITIKIGEAEATVTGTQWKSANPLISDLCQSICDYYLNCGTDYYSPVADPSPERTRADDCGF